MHEFVYTANPTRVVFGSGAINRLCSEVDRLQLTRVLVLSTPQQKDVAERLAETLGKRAFGVYAKATMHTPTDITDDALAIVTAHGCDGLLSVGGGSTIGLGKALALRTDLPQIVIPTTYSGSEMTPILGQTENGVKNTINDPKVLPEVVLYDVDMTLTLPAAVSVTSGMNAIAHAVEALYAEERNPITSLMAKEAITSLARSLPHLATNPMDLEHRQAALYGAWLCGICLGTVGMALHHKLCHTIGGMFDLPHSEMHTILLPHTLAYNSIAIPDVMEELNVVLGTENTPQHLYSIIVGAGVPRSLQQLGMPEDGITAAVEMALLKPYWNPRALEKDALTGLVTRAWRGDAPQTPLA